MLCIYGRFRILLEAKREKIKTYQKLSSKLCLKGLREGRREMAGNDWLNGYLEAILDVGNSSKKNNDGKIMKTAKFEETEKATEKLFSPTKYFVEEVVNSFDESDLHRTWIKVSHHFSLSLFNLLSLNKKSNINQLLN